MQQIINQSNKRVSAASPAYTICLVCERVMRAAHSSSPFLHRNKGIDSVATRCMWFAQTFLFGFASLGLLLQFDPERRKQH